MAYIHYIIFYPVYDEQRPGRDLFHPIQRLHDLESMPPFLRRTWEFFIFDDPHLPTMAQKGEQTRAGDQILKVSGRSA